MISKFILSKLLDIYFGDYISRYDRDQLRSSSLRKGKIDLRNVHLQPKVVQRLLRAINGGNPSAAHVAAATVQHLEAKFPWSKFPATPIRIQLHGLHILLHLAQDERDIPESDDAPLKRGEDRKRKGGLRSRLRRKKTLRRRKNGGEEEGEVEGEVEGSGSGVAWKRKHLEVDEFLHSLEGGGEKGEKGKQAFKVKSWTKKVLDNLELSLKDTTIEIRYHGAARAAQSTVSTAGRWEENGDLTLRCLLQAVELSTTLVHEQPRFVLRALEARGAEVRLREGLEAEEVLLLRPADILCRIINRIENGVETSTAHVVCPSVDATLTPHALRILTRFFGQRRRPAGRRFPPRLSSNAAPLRPLTPPKASPRAWLLYAVHRVLVDVRLAASSSSSSFDLLARLRERTRYVALYKQRRMGASLSKAKRRELVRLESSMPLDTVVLYRRFARAEAEEGPSKARRRQEHAGVVTVEQQMLYERVASDGESLPILPSHLRCTLNVLEACLTVQTDKKLALLCQSFRGLRIDADKSRVAKTVAMKIGALTPCKASGALVSLRLGTEDEVKDNAEVFPHREPAYASTFAECQSAALNDTALFALPVETVPSGCVLGVTVAGRPVGNADMRLCLANVLVECSRISALMNGLSSFGDAFEVRTGSDRAIMLSSLEANGIEVVVLTEEGAAVGCAKIGVARVAKEGEGRVAAAVVLEHVEGAWESGSTTFAPEKIVWMYSAGRISVHRPRLRCEDAWVLRDGIVQLQRTTGGTSVFARDCEFFIYSKWLQQFPATSFGTSPQQNSNISVALKDVRIVIPATSWPSKKVPESACVRVFVQSLEGDTSRMRTGIIAIYCAEERVCEVKSLGLEHGKWTLLEEDRLEACVSRRQFHSMAIIAAENMKFSIGQSDRQKPTLWLFPRLHLTLHFDDTTHEPFIVTAMDLCATLQNRRKSLTARGLNVKADRLSLLSIAASTTASVSVAHHENHSEMHLEAPQATVAALPLSLTYALRFFDGTRALRMEYATPRTRARELRLLLHVPSLELREDTLAARLSLESTQVQALSGDVSRSFELSNIQLFSSGEQLASNIHATVLCNKLRQEDARVNTYSYRIGRAHIRTDLSRMSGTLLALSALASKDAGTRAAWSRARTRPRPHLLTRTTRSVAIEQLKLTIRVKALPFVRCMLTRSVTSINSETLSTTGRAVHTANSVIVDDKDGASVSFFDAHSSAWAPLVDAFRFESVVQLKTGPNEGTPTLAATFATVDPINLTLSHAFCASLAAVQRAEVAPARIEGPAVVFKNNTGLPLNLRGQHFPEVALGPSAQRHVEWSDQYSAVSVTFPTGEWHTVQGVTLDEVGVRKFSLFPTTEAALASHLIVSVSVLGEETLVRLDSGVRLENRSTVALQLQLEDADHLLAPAQALDVPLDKLGAKVRLKPNTHPDYIEPMSLQSLAEARSVQCTSSADRAYQLQLKPKTSTTGISGIYAILVLPVLQIDSLLPCTLWLRIRLEAPTAAFEDSAVDLAVETSIESGQTYGVYEYLSPGQEMSVSLSVDEGERWSPWAAPCVDGSGTCRWRLPYTNVILFGASTISNGNPALAIYAEYWLMNRSRLRLNFAVADEATKATRDAEDSDAETICSKEIDYDEEGTSFLEDQEVWEMFSGNGSTLRVCAEEGGWSEGFSLEAVGIVGAITLPEGPTVGVEIGRAPYKFRRTKTVIFVPRYKVHNETPHVLQLRVNAGLVNLPPRETHTLTSPVIELRTIEAETVDANGNDHADGEAWSCAIDLRQSVHSALNVPAAAKDQPTALKVCSTVRGATMSLKVSTDAVYKIHNLTANVIHLRQDQGEAASNIPQSQAVANEEQDGLKWHKVLQGDTCKFGWEQLVEKPLLSLRLADDIDVMVPFDEPAQPKKVVNKKWAVSVRAEEGVRVVTVAAAAVSEEEELEGRSQQQRKWGISCEIRLVQVGLSLHDSFPQELLFATVDGVEVDILQQPLTGTRSLEVVLKDLQVDNQILSARLPVIVVPEDRGKAADEEGRRAVFHLSLIDRIGYVQYFSVLLQTLRIQLEEAWLLNIARFYQEVTSLIESDREWMRYRSIASDSPGSNQSSSPGNAKARRKGSGSWVEDMRDVSKSWLKPLQELLAKPIYYQEMQIHPVAARLTIQCLVDDIEEVVGFPNAFVQEAYDSALARRFFPALSFDVDAADVSLRGFAVNQSLITPRDLIETITQHFYR